MPTIKLFGMPSALFMRLGDFSLLVKQNAETISNEYMETMEKPTSGFGFCKGIFH